MTGTHAKPMRRRGALPSLDALRGFEAAARLMSFTRAASELFVTQSAVSRQIRAVESALGLPLFRRHNRRLELTPAGERMQRAVTRALAEVETAVDEVRGVASRVVTVTTPISFAALWLVPRLAAFRRAHPEIDLRIAANDDVVSLDQERMDCAIRFCEPGAAPRDAVPLMREEAFPVVAPALLGDRARPLRSPADLKHHVLLRYEDARGRVPAVDWNHWLALWKVPDLVPAGTLTFSHYDQAIAAAVEGEGVAIGRTPHIRRLLKAGKLVPPFANRMTVPRQHFMIVARGSRQRAEVKAFETWVLAEAEGDRPA